MGFVQVENRGISIQSNYKDQIRVNASYSLRSA